MPISYLKRPPSNKEDKKREKEQKKREEEERKRREKEEERKKKGINDKLSNSEDRLDKMVQRSLKGFPCVSSCIRFVLCPFPFYVCTIGLSRIRFVFHLVSTNG